MIARLAGALAHALVAVPASAQEGCDNWNTSDFFANATTESVAACLEAGADVNARTDSTFDELFFDGVYGHNTPLHFATIYSWDGMVTVLLAAGAEVDARNLSGETPLHRAAGRNRNPAVITELVEAGADPNARDGDGNTPLHASRRNTNPAVALLLLELGADPTLVNDSGRVAGAMDCSYWNTEEFARVATAEATVACLAAGADVSARDENEYTPLLLATYHGGGGSTTGEFTAVVTVLLEAGADVNARGNVRNTALHHAAAGKYEQSARDRSDHVETPDVVAALLAAGADVHARDLNGNRPLHHAASAEGIETAAMLLEAGADISVRDREGNTPLLMAAERGLRSPEILEVLVEAEADVNDRNERGETVLERVLRYPSDRLTDVVRRLLDLGADANAPGFVSTPLYHAASAGDNPELIAVLLDAGADVTGRSRGGQSPLHWAAYGGGPGVIAALVAVGAEVDAQDGDDRTPLHRAIERKKPANVAALIEAGANVHAVFQDGNTPLHLTAAWPPGRSTRRDGPPDPADTLMVIALVAAGADVNARNDRGETPLHVATKNRHQPVVDKLLALGAEPVAVDASGRTPLPMVCNWTNRQFFQFASWESVVGCLQAGADVHTHGESGETPLHQFVSEAPMPTQLPVPSYPELDTYPIARVIAAFVEAGADVNAPDRGGGTPLHHAVGRIYNRTTRTARALLDAGAEVNARDGRGETPLHRASGAEGPLTDSLVFLLVAAGADVNATDDGGRTALHHALQRDNPAIAARLIELGADVTARDESGRVANPVDCARFNNATFFHLAPAETVTGCIEGGADVNARSDQLGGGLVDRSTPLHFASVWSRDPAIVLLLVQAGADVNARGYFGDTPLVAAAGRTNDPAMIVALVEAGAELNVWSQGIHSPYGWSPLHSAAHENSNPAVTAALIEAGADIHARQNDGPTPLHDAATKEVVALLLAAGADIEARATYLGWRQPNGRDMTPLHVAAKRGNAAVFMALLEAGADPEALDVEGKTPLDHAREQKALQELEVVKRSGG